MEKALKNNSFTQIKPLNKNLERYEKREKLGLPKYKLGEEIFSAVTHGVSAIFAIVALVLLLAASEKTILNVTTTAVFGGMMVLLYTVSTIYHALGINRAKRVFRVLDHCTIFLLIAGTYTPLTLACVGGVWGITMFSVVWIAAIVGVTLNAIDLKKYTVFSMICYISMGWVVVFAINPILTNMSSFGVLMLFLGGVAYTLGAVVYGIGKKVPYMHSIWHLFVLAGSVLHAICVYTVVS